MNNHFLAETLEEAVSQIVVLFAELTLFLLLGMLAMYAVQLISCGINWLHAFLG